MRRLPLHLCAFVLTAALLRCTSACGDFSGADMEDEAAPQHPDCSAMPELRTLRESPLNKDRVLVRVMTFNIWLSGAEVLICPILSHFEMKVNDGMEKIARQIHDVNPDIVALQEVESPDVITNLTEMLGEPWIGISHPINETNKYPDTGILTRHQILDDSLSDVYAGVGVRIQLVPSQRQINFWSLHLDYKSYGPYAAFNKRVNHMSQIEAGENPKSRIGRVQNIVEFTKHPKVLRAIEKSSIIPLIVAGDFNCPSHHDWVEGNKGEHGDWVYPWPTTMILEAETGLIDSYRAVNPDPVADPGHTWSTVNKFDAEWDYQIPEPQDRIDFIFYRGPLDVLVSRTFAGADPLTPIPHQWKNTWPSDHYAVVSAFAFNDSS